MSKVKKHSPAKAPLEQPKPSTRPKNHECCICGHVSPHVRQCDYCDDYFCDGSNDEVYDHSDVTGYSSQWNYDDSDDFLCAKCYTKDQERENKREQYYKKDREKRVKNEIMSWGYNGKLV